MQPEPRLRIRHHGELVANIPNRSLTDDAPLYRRPVGVWKCPLPVDPPDEAVAKLAEDRDYTANLKKLLASPNVCSKRWVHEQYALAVSKRAESYFCPPLEPGFKPSNHAILAQPALQEVAKRGLRHWFPSKSRG